MKTYIAWYLPQSEWYELEGKRVANRYAKDPDFKVWLVEGRKGSERNKKLALLKDALRKGSEVSPGLAVPYYPVRVSATRSEEHNAKIAKSMRGRSLSQSHKDAISAAMMGNANRRR